MSKKRLILISILATMMLIAGTATAGRGDASESTITLEEDDFDIDMLLTSNGEPVQVWIDSIESHNGSTPHAIDVYIASSDEYWDHFCGGEGNMFAEEFSPVYSKENLQISELPFEFTWTPEDDESYYLIFDNCDNQRTTDYKDDLSAVKLSYAVDDQTDELGEAVAGFLGMGFLVMCGVPTCCGLLIVILLVKLVFKKPQQVVVQASAPIGGGGAMPVIGAPVAAPVAAAHPPMAAPDPAREYYNSLLGQGYDAATAASHTNQHYPGFQP